MGDDIKSIIRQSIHKMTDNEIIKELEMSWDSIEHAFLLDEVKSRYPDLFSKNYNTTIQKLEIAGLIKEMIRQEFKTSVKGFDKLTPEQQGTLISTNKRHKAGVGTDYKDGWTPVSVKSLGENLKVSFKNGEWLHYTPSGDWY